MYRTLDRPYLAMFQNIRNKQAVKDRVFHGNRTSISFPITHLRVNIRLGRVNGSQGVRMLRAGALAGPPAAFSAEPT